MRESRRNLFQRASIAGAVFMAAGLFAPAAFAQAWPTQDVRFVVGFPPGSGADVITRYFADKMAGKSKRTFIVENRVGAAGNIAVEAVARAKPDGHTVLLGTGSALAASMHLFKTPPVDVTKAFRMATTLSRQAFMMVVTANSPYKSVQEITKAMIEKGDKANYGTAAPSGIVMGEVYKAMTGVKAVEIRFRTAADSLPELHSGRLDYAMIDPQVALAQAAQKSIRILGHSAGSRFKSQPDIPTMEEGGVKGMNLTGWWMMAVPAATPDAVVRQMHTWANEILAEKETQDFLARTGGDVFMTSLEEAQALFISDEKAWGQYVSIAKLEKQ